MTRLTVAAVQMNSGNEPEANLAALQVLLDEVAAAGASMAVLPENLLCMGRHEREKFDSADQPPDTTWRDRVLSLGAERGIGLIAGSLYQRHAADDRLTARCWLSDTSGAVCGHYDKRHLFDVEAGPGEHYRESNTIAPGSNPPQLVCCAGLKWGLSICYDLRFAEHYAELRAAGAEVLTVPAAFTHTTGSAHWETLLRARAIETQCYVVAANQCGGHPGGRKTWGHSMIVDPWGTVLATAAEEPGIIYAELDRDRLSDLRQRFPVFSHRRS